MSIFTDLSKKYNLKKIKKKYTNIFSKELNITKLSKITQDIYQKSMECFTIEEWYKGIALTLPTTDKTDPMLYTKIKKEAEPIFNELEIPLQPIMSRIGVLFGDNDFTRDVGWHIDQSCYELLRLNIPIITNKNFLFQMDNQLPIHFEIGKMYWWNTKIPHRVFSSVKSNEVRLHLVLGFSPWFVYNHNKNEWQPNEYFNKIHPLEIIGGNSV